MSTEEQSVPFGNHQFDIYLNGLSGETPQLPIDHRLGRAEGRCARRAGDRVERDLLVRA